MKSTTLAVLMGGLLLASSAEANQAEHIHASHAWIRVLPGNLPAGGYVTLTNDSDEPALLKAAKSPRYGQTMLHESSTAGGMSQMMAVTSVTVPAHGQMRFAPGSYHLMLMQAKQTVMPGQTVPVTLSFADGSSLVSQFLARPANAVGPDDGKEATPDSH